MNEPNLKYEPVHPASKSELVRKLESTDPIAVVEALHAAARYESDWRWVQNVCIEALKSSDVSIRWAAATCLGDLAFFRHPLDTDIVVPALEAAMQDPQIADPATFSLSMVKQYLAPK